MLHHEIKRKQVAIDAMISHNKKILDLLHSTLETPASEDATQKKQ